MTHPCTKVPSLTPFELDGSFVARFTRVARAAPNAVALASPGRQLSFSETDRASERLAAALHEALGHDARLSTEAPIATLLPHDVSGLLGLLSALRLGRPVVPLDSRLPPGRLEQIAAVAGVTACLTDASHRALALEAGLAPERVLDLEQLSASEAKRLERPESVGRDVAAIVFTSGSTGAPKGVVWTHGTLLNEAYAGLQRLCFAPGDRVALVLPYSFAAGLTVFVFALLNGAATYAFDPREAGLPGLPDWIDSQQLTTLHTTPSLLRALVAALRPDQTLSSLRLLTTCGEAVHGADIAAARAHLPKRCAYVNWSGASEIGSLAWNPIEPDLPLPEGPVPAGFPAAGKEVSLVREDGSVAAPGETGEVVVSSAYLAAGYWRAPEATAARFSALPDGRSRYATGDLGRLDTRGVLTLLGRRDAALKIRGSLVEPSEIEAALRGIAAVRDAVVIAVESGRGDGGPATHKLCAYIVARDPNSTPSAAALRGMLAHKLPGYMVPPCIIWLPELPRNERGKVDRLALPPPSTAPRPFVVPRTQWEIVMADLWMKVLHLDEVSANDDFIELGGDSLRAAELLAAISDECGIRLPSSALVEAPTLAAFSERVSNAERALIHPTLSVLRSDGTRPPLFCFAGAGALGLGFMSLARHLGDRQPVYAFQAHGLEQRGLPDWSVQQAAERHLRDLRLLAPRGPYFLAGHSLGGLIALEVAQRLRRAGEEVALLALLDTYLPAKSLKAPLPVSPARDGYPSQNILAKLLGAARAGRSRGRLGVRLARDLWSELGHTFRHRLRASALANMLFVVFSGVVRYPGRLQFDVFFHQGRVLERFYYPKVWDGRTLIYRARDNGDPVDGWAAFLAGSHSVHELPCEHFSVLRDPHVAKIAEHVTREIDRALSSKPQPTTHAPIEAIQA